MENKCTGFQILGKVGLKVANKVATLVKARLKDVSGVATVVNVGLKDVSGVATLVNVGLKGKLTAWRSESSKMPR